MLSRKIDSYLKDYYQKSSNALLITGARQVGKTYSIREFGKTFKSFIEINFIENPDAVGLFKDAKGSADILMRLSTITNVPMIKGDTLIFFDEVQECPNIVTAIKFLVDEGSYRYILSGSLLGVELKDIRSVPVGYMGVKEMFPLDFEEFITCVGINENVISTLKDAWTKRIPVDGFIHNKMMELFRLYLIVGGMPAAVSKYLESNNLRDVLAVQQEIIQLYKKDIAKYDPDNKLYIEEIFNLIPPELNAKNKRFILKRLNENAKYEPRSLCCCLAPATFSSSSSATLVYWQPNMPTASRCGLSRAIRTSTSVLSMRMLWRRNLSHTVWSPITTTARRGESWTSS